jgi:hypothetical protein
MKKSLPASSAIIHNSAKKLRKGTVVLKFIRSTLAMLSICVGFGVFPVNVQAELTLLAEEKLTDSENDFSRRIYSYDFAVSADGTIHAVYSKPVPGANRAQVIYMTKAVGGAWPAESARTVLEEYGTVDTNSTWILLDKNGVAHASYLVRRDFIDENNYTAESGLVYQKINNATPSAKINVASGAFHTRMQLSKDGQPIFAREYEIFMDEDGALLPQPYARALRLLLPQSGLANTWISKVLSLPYPTLEGITEAACLANAKACKYRLANFIFDSSNNRFHIAYGDHDGAALHAAYPTANPPATSGTYFPPGAGHKLWYAVSDNVLSMSGAPNASSDWQISLVDASGNLAENEFWTDLVLDVQGAPYVTAYRYATDARGIHMGTSGIIGKYSAGSWQTATVAGSTTGASQHRAGMGAKILIDESGHFHGIWDNSPDKPIDSESPLGTTMYRYSPDGINWRTRQVILAHSVEGFVRAVIHSNRLLVMVLGDARTPRLTFAEYALPAANDNLLEIKTDKMFYGHGEQITLHARLQGQGNGDLYVVAAGPYDVASNGSLIPVASSFQYSYLTASLAWQPFAAENLLNIPPLLANVPLASFNSDLLLATAGVATPFHKPARYVVYSVINQPGKPLGALTSPLHSYQLHVCTQPRCAEM